MRTRKFVLAPVFLVPALLIVTVGLVMAVAAFLIQDDNPRTEELYAARGDAPVEDVAPPSSGASEDAQTASDQATPAPAESGQLVLLSSPARLRIERLEVDAPLVSLGVDASSGNMADPEGPELVGWYDFSGRPGAGTGNAVFAGHRDWAGYGAAVFYDLETLEAGDVVEVELQDGSRVSYTVTAEHTYPIDEIDMREVLARTDEETLTLITCAGQFEAGDYDERHVVRAVRSDATRGS